MERTPKDVRSRLFNFGERRRQWGPDWISEKVDSIANSKKDPEEEVLEGMQEDVYSLSTRVFSGE